MTKEEIKDFKKFLHEKNIFLMFTQNYRNYRLTINPPTWEAYLENARVENVIPQAFVYPKSIYDKDFWLAMHEEWQKRISAKRAVYREATQLEYLDLEIIDVKSRTSCLGLPKNTCSLSLRGGKRFTLNMDDSKRVAKTSGSRCQSGLFPAEYRAAVRDKGLSIVYDKEKGKRIKEVVRH